GDFQDFYQTSFAWYGVFSIGTCLIVGNVVSVLTHLFNKLFLWPNCTAPKEGNLYYNCADNCCCYCSNPVKACLRCGIEFEEENEPDAEESLTYAMVQRLIGLLKKFE
ncbi:hypothetical protein CAPTEDRAFT_192817, partial [Capitella teleta]